MKRQKPDGTPPNLYRPPGTPFYYVRITINGRKVRKSTKATTLEEAMRVRDRWLSRRTAEEAEQQWTDWVNEQETSAKSWTRLTWARMRRRTRRKGWDRCMSLSELLQLVHESGGRCAISGLKLKAPVTGRLRKDPMNASIDRIDCSQGYTRENCRVVALALNIAMSDWGEPTVRRLARALVFQELERAENRTRI